MQFFAVHTARVCLCMRESLLICHFDCYYDRILDQTTENLGMTFLLLLHRPRRRRRRRPFFPSDYSHRVSPPPEPLRQHQGLHGRLL